MAQEVTQDHRLLKAVVIGLGLLILLGFGALIFGLIAKSGKRAPAAPFPASQSISLAPGTSITGIALSEGELVLRVTKPDGEELLVIDTRSGRVITIIPVRRSTAAQD